MMRRNLLLLVMATALSFSCSSDKDENKTDENSIVGTWDLTALEIDESTASDDAKNGRDILNFLSANDCAIFTLTFNEDLSVTTENSGNYLEINVNPGGTGLDIPCPTQKDTEVDNYTFDGDMLTYIDENDVETTVAVDISGNTMRVNATDLDITNFDDSGQLVFTKR